MSRRGTSYYTNDPYTRRDSNPRLFRCKRNAVAAVPLVHKSAVTTELASANVGLTILCLGWFGFVTISGDVLPLDDGLTL